MWNIQFFMIFLFQRVLQVLTLFLLWDIQIKLFIGIMNLVLLILMKMSFGLFWKCKMVINLSFGELLKLNTLNERRFLLKTL